MPAAPSSTGTCRAPASDGASPTVDNAEASAKYLKALHDTTESGTGLKGNVALLTGLAPGMTYPPAL